ncbi:hypothetical protein ACFQI7_25330 [Paenibacillus allorhizosphaerae]|uniref:Dihydroorotate dehydrogenase (Quinone) n=1 Tax=Paenibacillus allorhizosphaerae TaxID=2849866 RepID=A0ABM8VJ84_9BACL|nr:hypothetical protein [Paenibacillus allorhizosphaerae]CAG7645152.1 Dihydroorotate dehydrogenase (quinone) [Paenibacillus allorhizosphaerae]
MPDWSYQTVFRPVLFRLPSETARDFTLQAMGLISRMPGGTFLIRTLGHMESSPILESELAGIQIPYPVGLSGTLDSQGTANKAMSPFGFGFIEIGPITPEEIVAHRRIRREPEAEVIVYPEPYANAGLAKTVWRLQKKQGHRLPLFIRTRQMPGSTWEAACAQQLSGMTELAPYASAFYIDAYDHAWSAERNAELANRLQREARERWGQEKPLLLYVPLDISEQTLEKLIHQIRPAEWDGIVLGEALRTTEGAAVGKPAKAVSLALIGRLRELCDARLALIASGGIHEPQDALDLLEAGATYVQLHSGLVYAGPGLPKRINEAIISERIRQGILPEAELPSFWSGWGWMCLLGIGMMIGGLLAWLIAATQVVLPYDLSFLGLSRGELSATNARLLGFMSHDRVTLAGTMISIGILYFQLAWHGLRYRHHWAKTALMTSGLVGFSSFFLYLGYGYFDPLHAVAAAVLLPMFILSMRAGADAPPRDAPSRINDRMWLRAQWGQLMLVSLGIALAVGGLVIAGVGVTGVFVPQDLQYLCTSPDMLNAINERLVPLIAHDRAGFGGALFSDALALLIMALWGINQGRRWLWWTFLLGGLPGFVAGFSVHFQIGYTDFMHLLPAYFAFALYAAGLVLLYPYMMRRETAYR